MITTANTDTNGLSIITDNHVVHSVFIDTSLGEFGVPSTNFTGYASDGLKRNSGIVDETDVASWSSESPSSNRSSVDSFPTRVFILANGQSVVILNADNLDVWMRFNYSNDPYQLVFEDGYLGVVFSDRIKIYSFIEDKFWEFSNTAATQYSSILNRNNPTGGTSGSQRLYSNVIHAMDIKKILGNWLVSVADFDGLVGFTINGFNISSSTFNKNQFHKTITLNNTASVTLTSDQIIQDLPYTPNNPTDYSSIGLYGDRIQLVAPVTSTNNIKLVQTTVDRFVVDDPDLQITPATHSTLTLKLIKPCYVCSILSDGSLLYSAGQSFYRSITSWLSGSIDVFTESHSVPPVLLDINEPISDLYQDSDELLIATSEGVCSITTERIAGSQPYELRYSDNPAATYSSIFSSSIRPTSSVGLDPQNGNVLLSSGTYLYEIQSSAGLHKLIRSFNTGSQVRHILGFSNVNNTLGV